MQPRECAGKHGLPPVEPEVAVAEADTSQFLSSVQTLSAEVEVSVAGQPAVPLHLLAESYLLPLPKTKCIAFLGDPSQPTTEGSSSP